MPEVLKRLREIEKEVLSRADEAAEHVGSIRLVNHSGKRAMPSFEPPVPGVTEEPSVEVREVDGEGEDDVRKMEEEALDTLAKLDVGGGGASILDSEGGTWRTARWDEAMFDAMHESEIKGKHTPTAGSFVHSLTFRPSTTAPIERHIFLICLGSAYRLDLLNRCRPR